MRQRVDVNEDQSSRPMGSAVDYSTQRHSEDEEQQIRDSDRAHGSTEVNAAGSDHAPSSTGVPSRDDDQPRATEPNQVRDGPQGFEAAAGGSGGDHGVTGTGVVA